MTRVARPENGWHWKEWLAELAGTAMLLFAVVTAKYWAVRAGSPVSDTPVAVAIIAAVAGLAVIAVAFSPLGRRSGAHLNPAVTVGLWLQKVTGSADLAGYRRYPVGRQIRFASGAESELTEIRAGNHPRPPVQPCPSAGIKSQCRFSGRTRHRGRAVRQLPGYLDRPGRSPRALAGGRAMPQRNHRRPRRCKNSPQGETKP